VLVTLVSTMLAHPVVPAAGLAMTLGVDRFLNEGRAVINLIGNAVATLAIARWDRSLDTARMHAVLRGETAKRSQEILAQPSPKNVLFRDSSGDA
jgi:aerobic C4-dicarboxylate transport protein